MGSQLSIALSKVLHRPYKTFSHIGEAKKRSVVPKKLIWEYSLSSTNATKVFFNLAIRGSRHEKRYHYHQHVVDLTMPDNTKTIYELLECKNRIIVKASATRALTAKGWYYYGMQQVHGKSGR
ncbi:hypothetical protein MKX03_029812 [Papaver bracteatum]|nr:hypothetical protein MKX03_029812 [Papaver bracteatum]